MAEAKKTGGEKRSARAAGEHSPAMKQLFRAKEQHPDALVFFRMGDFYELFYDDAIVAGRALDIAVTSRAKAPDGTDIPMAGVPHFAATGYLARLLEQGFKVAICEQMADPRTVKGLVPREVVRVVSPGLVLETDALPAGEDNLLVAVAEEGGRLGLSALELSRAELRACSVPSEMAALSELLRLGPREVLFVGARIEGLGRSLERALRQVRVEVVPRSPAAALEPLLDPGALARAEAGLSLEALAAAAAVASFAQRSQPRAPLHLGEVIAYDPSGTLALDETVVRSLELLRPQSGGRIGSLLHLLDQTRTAMGSRLLRRRVIEPSTDAAEIRGRHDVVEAFVRGAEARGELRAALGRVSDLERLATRAELGVATPRDLAALRDGLGGAAEVRARLLGEAGRERALAAQAPGDACEDVRARIEAVLVDAPPVLATQGGLVRDGVEPALDELRTLATSAKDVLLALEARERERSGIGSLKVRFTKVFGYYFEVTRSNLHLVPAHFRRKQTIANGERYTTDELDELADKILHAEDRARVLEQGIVEGLVREVGAAAPRLRALGREVARVDVAACLAEVAVRRGYVRPVIDETLALELEGCRHPVVETLAESGTFVPNDVRLDALGERMMVVTGPNMAGKSTTMRQVALGVILAQMGAFVPATRARIGIVDRIYSRVGASDDVSRGESTFMVEMKETAALLSGASRRSLVLLDEIGRGTSTYDGLSIAWAVAEHLVDAIGCRALFATHYHELCALEAARPGAVANWNVAAKEKDGTVVFLHRLVRGGSNRSHGVAVARLAGLPPSVVTRAEAVLAELERTRAQPERSAAPPGAERSPQLALFGDALAPGPPPAAPMPVSSEVERELRALDVERLTPLEALVTLARLKEQVR